MKKLRTTLIYQHTWHGLSALSQKLASMDTWHTVPVKPVGQAQVVELPCLSSWQSPPFWHSYSGRWQRGPENKITNQCRNYIKLIFSWFLMNKIVRELKFQIQNTSYHYQFHKFLLSNVCNNHNDSSPGMEYTGHVYHKVVRNRGQQIHL